MKNVHPLNAFKMHIECHMMSSDAVHLLKLMIYAIEEAKSVASLVDHRC